MTERAAAELEALRRVYPDLEFFEDGQWVRLPRYRIPPGWSATEVEVAFQIPPQIATAPYGFYVRPIITLAGGGKPENYNAAISAGILPAAWGGGWAHFSWQNESWRPQDDVAAGDNMLHFARSFADRFRELV